MKFLKDLAWILGAGLGSAAVCVAAILVFQDPRAKATEELVEAPEKPGIYIGVDGHAPLKVKGAYFSYGVCQVEFLDGSTAAINAAHKVTILREAK